MNQWFLGDSELICDMCCIEDHVGQIAYCLLYMFKARICHCDMCSVY